VKWCGSIILLLLLTLPVFAQSPEAPEQNPSFDRMVEWKLHPSLGIIVRFIDKDGHMLFAYPVLSSYPVRECREYAYYGNEVYLMSKDIRYIVSEMPLLYRKPPNDWEMWNGRKQ